MTDSATETPDASVAPEPTGALAATPRPRIRTGAVLWGLLVVAISSFVLWTALAPERRDAVLDAVRSLDGFGWTVAAVVTLGGILTLFALAAVIRGVQRRRATHT